MEAAYNKVPDWDYSKLCATFGPSFKSKHYRVETKDELVKLLANSEFNAAESMQVSKVAGLTYMR